MKGEALYWLKRYEEAVASFQEAVAYDRRGFDSWEHLGVALHKLGQHHDALDAISMRCPRRPILRRAGSSAANVSRRSSTSTRASLPTVRPFAFSRGIRRRGATWASGWPTPGRPVKPNTGWPRMAGSRRDRSQPGRRCGQHGDASASDARPGPSTGGLRAGADRLAESVAASRYLGRHALSMRVTRGHVAGPSTIQISRRPNA